MENIQLKETKTSFWQEIKKKNSIIIPQIQRDYAQGRDESDVLEIRNKILDKFYSAIKTATPIDIDFVYGYSQENQFIPLDGQQRLTTLFLIHWYIAKRSNASEINELYKFRYQTRQSSTDFCKALINAQIIFSPDVNLKDWIIDNQWFLFSWIKDPTINGMLTMIQSIHLKFGNNYEDFKTLWNNLIISTPITFNFLSIENSGLNDELYIKMNSRGKPLTSFENFKVWFEKKYPENKNWQNKIDNEWTNLFWKYRSSFNSPKSNNNTMDEEFMQFINGMVMFGLAQKGFKDEVQFFANNNEIALSKYEEGKLDIFSVNQVEIITKTLDWIFKYHQILHDSLKGINFWKEKSIFETFISDKLSYSDRVIFFAIVHFVNQLDEYNFGETNFKQWIRIARNLIENTTIDSPDTFINAIRSINALGNYCLKMHDYLVGTNNKLSFFLTSQLEEEILKVRLIKNDSNWETALLKVENHELFRGNIGFLLLDELECKIEEFIAKGNLAASLFNKNGSLDEYKSEYQLIRATLAQSSVENDIRLLDNGENWRVLLKRPDTKPSISRIVKELRNIPLGEFNSYFNSIIDDYVSSEILWKYQVVKNKILLTSYTSRSKFIKEYYGSYYLFNNENGNWINNYNQILLSNYRNELIDFLLNYSDEIQLNVSNNRDWWVVKDPLTNKSFYRGDVIWLHKKIKGIELTFECTSTILIIGFNNELKDLIEMPHDENYKQVGNYFSSINFKIPETQNELLNCFENIKVKLPSFENTLLLKSEVI